MSNGRLLLSSHSAVIEIVLEYILPGMQPSVMLAMNTKPARCGCELSPTRKSFTVFFLFPVAAGVP